MATIRHLGVATRSLPIVLALVMAGVLGAHTPTRPAAVRPAAVAVQQVRHGVSADDPAGHPKPPALSPAAVAPATDRARSLTAQHVADARVSRAPPAAPR
ncbi:hypothetical protein [Actinoplanes xinjiangensis]|uniref:hypothetical protein n=1 Tax=Actinoplanes xinjiangensis TaxID=512350 RepID=UPI003424D9B3